jgi:hypothetical protein
MTKIIISNSNTLLVSDDKSIGDTIIVGDSIDAAVSAVGSSNHSITLGHGAGDAVNADNSCDHNAISLVHGAADTASAKQLHHDHRRQRCR